jgi:hypothetical protein
VWLPRLMSVSGVVEDWEVAVSSTEVSSDRSVSVSLLCVPNVLELSSDVLVELELSVLCALAGNLKTGAKYRCVAPRWLLKLV